MKMRSLWCTLIALCLVAAGTTPRGPLRTRDALSALQAPHVSVPNQARRPLSRHAIGPYLAAPAEEAPSAPRIFAQVALATPASPVLRPVFSARTSRGPPRG
jgi:hypothetical protein